jgi:hypothetical protein
MIEHGFSSILCGASVKKYLVLAAILGFGAYVAFSFWNERDKRAALNAAARDLLGNFHPAYLSKIREQLVRRARTLGVKLREEDIEIGRQPTARPSAASAIAKKMMGVEVQTFLVTMRLRYRTKLLGFDRRHEVSLERVVTGDAAGEPDPGEAQRGAGGPLPQIVD